MSRAILIASTGELAAPIGTVPGFPARPARRRDIVSIFCTGLGTVTNQPASGTAATADPLSKTFATPTVTMAGVEAPVLFSGLAPEFAGLYQVNVEVPEAAPTGDAVDVVLLIGGVNSNTVTIAVQ